MMWREQERASVKMIDIIWETEDGALDAPGPAPADVLRQRMLSATSKGVFLALPSVVAKKNRFS